MTQRAPSSGSPTRVRSQDAATIAPRPPALPKRPPTWPCVILAIEPGQVCGWALFAHGEPEMGNEIDSYDGSHVRGVVLLALGRAYWLGLPCVLVITRPADDTIDAGEALRARTNWRAAWSSFGGHAGKVLDVPARKYRAALLGPGCASTPLDEVRAVELAAARAIIGAMAGDLGAAEAAAVCMGKWAAHDRAVGLVLGERASYGALAEATEVDNAR